METSTRYCAHILKKAGSNFRHAFRFLNPPQRRAMTAVYAFCRVIDDIVDGPSSSTEKSGGLAFWRQEMARVEAGGATEPLTQELHWAVHAFDIPTKYLRELIDGCARDIDFAPLQTLGDLERYCYGVAGTVGLMCCRIFGVTETPTVRSAAIALGNAFQLTNVLRDLAADAKIGRIYLPAEDLIRFGVPAEHLGLGKESPQLAQLIAFEVRRAEEYFQSAWAQFGEDVEGKLRPAQTMSVCYYALLSQIRKNPLRVMRTRVRLSWWKKLRLLGASRWALVKNHQQPATSN